MEPLPFEIPYERMAVAARATVGDKRLIVYCAVEDGLLLNYLKNGRAIRVRRLRVPKGVLLHHQDVPKGDRVELGAVPVTSVLRTLTDCADVHVSPELIEAAVRQARERGFIDNGDARRIRARSRAA